MNKICCKSCKSYIYSQEKLAKFQCLPCKSRMNPSELTCTACRKSNGIMIRANGGEWIHYYCMMILKDLVDNNYTKAENMNKDLYSNINIAIPRKMFKTSCFKCKSSRSSAVINCSNCKNEIHIACLDEKGLISCGCCELPKKRGRKPNEKKVPGNETSKEKIEHKDFSKLTGLSLPEIVEKCLDEIEELDKDQYLGEDQEDHCIKKLKIEESSNGSTNVSFRIEPVKKISRKRGPKKRNLSPSFPDYEKKSKV